MWLLVSYLCVVMPDGDPQCERDAGYFRSDLASCVELRDPMEAQLAERAEALRARVIYLRVTCEKGRDL
jgi:hypothetical protein